MLRLLRDFEANCNSRLSQGRQTLKNLRGYQIHARHFPISTTSRFLQMDALDLANRKPQRTIALPQQLSNSDKQTSKRS